ncbi:MAG: hypothetical protein ABIG61_17065 [Planctomycetota bacterium]
MWDVLIKSLELIFKSFSKLRPSVVVEVNCFRYSLIENNPDSSVIIIDPPPSRYWAKLQLTNRTNSIIYIKDILVNINNSRLYNQIQHKDKIRLEPHECVDYSIIFPVPYDENPEKNGTYSLKVIPTTGRATCITGDFS